MLSRKHFIRNSAVLTGAMVLGNLTGFARALLSEGYTVRMLTKKIGVFTERGGTVLFMLSAKGNIIVDTQFPESIVHCIDEIKKKGMPVFDLVVNTHHHGDHTSGNINFKGLAKRLLAHQNSKTNQENVAREKKTEDKQWFPDHTYETVWEEPVDKDVLRVSYFGAGHTNGDSVVYFKKAGIAHVGDLVFNRRHPYVDTGAGANIKSWIRVLDTIMKTYPAKTKFVCGHAGDGYDIIITKEDISAFKDYLSKVLVYVDAQIKAGKTKEEILKTTTISGAEEWKGDGIERPLTAAYIELTK